MSSRKRCGRSYSARRTKPGVPRIQRPRPKKLHPSGLHLLPLHEAESRPNPNPRPRRRPPGRQPRSRPTRTRGSSDRGGIRLRARIPRIRRKPGRYGGHIQVRLRGRRGIPCRGPDFLPLQDGTQVFREPAALSQCGRIRNHVPEAPGGLGRDPGRGGGARAGTGHGRSARVLARWISTCSSTARRSWTFPASSSRTRDCRSGCSCSYLSWSWRLPWRILVPVSPSLPSRSDYPTKVFTSKRGAGL